MKKLFGKGASLLRLSLLLPAMLLALFALSLQTAKAADEQVTISGSVYLDSVVGTSGQIDATDTQLTGITVYLYNSAGTLVDTQVTTGIFETYTFFITTPGTYTAVVQDFTGTGYSLVGAFPGTGSGGTATQSTKVPFPAGHSNAITVTIAQTDLDNFATFQPEDFLVNQSSSGNQGNSGSISGTLFCDCNGNGKLDTGEDVLPGLTVTLLSSTGATVATTTTDANGNYSFASVPAGTYTVAVPGTGDGLKANKTSASVTVTTTNVVQNFTYYGGMISGYAFWDTDCDGYRDRTEKTGISNVTITLKDCSGNILETTTTDCNGYYSFSDCIAAGKYMVCAPNCLSTHVDTHSYCHEDQCDKCGNIDNCDDYNERLTSCNCLSVCLNIAQSSQNNNFGYRKSCNISGNTCGDHSCSNRSISCVKVSLKDCYGHTICSCDTDDSGHYCFKDCPEGNYTVCVSKNLKTHCTSNHEACDSTSSSSYGCNRTYSSSCSTSVTVHCGDKSTCNNFQYKSCN